MKHLTDILIDVDYHPCDPGNSTWYCERTRVPKDEVVPGKALHYSDPGGLFSAILVVDVSDGKLVVSYGTRTYTLDEESPSVLLDRGGRDYTEFELSVSARFAPDDVDREIADRQEDDDYEDDDGRWDPYV